MALRPQDQNDYFNCPACGDFNSPVTCDGAEWCPKCGVERCNIVVGDDFQAGSSFFDEHHTQGGAQNVIDRYTDRTQSKIRQDMIRITDAHDIPQAIAETALDTFMEIRRQRDTRGGLQQALLANCLYRELIRASLPRSCKVIKSMFSVTSKKFNEAEKIYAMFVGNERSIPSSSNHNNDTYDFAKDYGIAGCMYRHATFVKDTQICRKAIRILSDILKFNVELHGKSPDKLSAAAIVFVHHESKKSLCESCYGADVIACVDCVKFACDNFSIAKQTLLSHFKTIKNLSEVDAVARDISTTSISCPTPSA